jgi:hypothetical protein
LPTAIEKADRNCVFIIDNTDVMKKLSLTVDNHFGAKDIMRLPGWVPGIFHANETTMVLRRQ